MKMIIIFLQHLFKNNFEMEAVANIDPPTYLL